MNMYFKEINIGSNSFTINFGAEELFRPYNEECAPPPRCDPDTPADDPTCAVPIPSPPEDPVIGSGTDWYSENCDDCCHPITDRIINYMEFVVVTFFSPGYTQNITCEGVDVDAIVSNAVSAGDAVVNSVDPKQHTAGLLSNTRIKTKPDGTQVYDLDYSTSFTLDRDLEHAEVVTYMKVDFDAMQSEFDFTASPSLQSEIKKRMAMRPTHEIVIEKKRPASNSYIFTEKETGRIWSGQTHYHPTKGYMAGPRHSMLPHPALTRRKVPNVKVKDDRIKDEILAIDIGQSLADDPKRSFNKLNTSSSDKQINAGLISDSIVSKTPDGKARFLFYLDYASVIRAESKFPGLKNNAVFQGAPIESMQIYRERATLNKDKTELGVNKCGNARLENYTDDRQLVVSTSDKKSYSDTPSMYNSEALKVSSAGLRKATRKIDANFDGVEETTTGDIEEVQIRNLSDKGLRTFSVTDEEIAGFTNGQYRHLAEIQLRDPSADYLNQKLQQMCAVKDKLADYESLLSNTPAYDNINRLFKDSHRKSYGTRHNRIVRDSIVQIMQLLRVTKGRINKRHLNYLVSTSNIQSGSPAGIESLLEIMNTLESKLRDTLDGNLSLDNSNYAKIESDNSIRNRSNPDSNMITLVKEFGSIIDRNKSDRVGIDYVGAKVRSFPNMTTQEYAERVQQERKKFYSDKPPAGQQENNSVA